MEKIISVKYAIELIHSLSHLWLLFGLALLIFIIGCAAIVARKSAPHSTHDKQANSTTRQYIKFTAATQGSKIEGEQANKIFQSFAKTFAALGASNITAERGLLAIGQMISKNNVGAEELRQQLGDALPGSVRLFTEAYKELHNMSDLTTGEFMKLMRDGKVLAEDILPIVAKKLEDIYGSKAQRNLQTISGSWTTEKGLAKAGF